MQDLKTAYFFDLSAFAHATLFKDALYPWEALAHISRYLKTTHMGVIDGIVSPQAYLVNPELITIGPGSIVEAGAYIQGPCIIGAHCTVRHGAYIRGNFIAGNRCVIGHDTEVKNSIFLDGVQAAHFAYVGDSILGNDVNLGAGTKCANLKLDHESIVIHYQNQRLHTGLKKLGAILGDRTQIGCNSVTNPGTLMGPGVRCYPCVNVGGCIPAYSCIKPQTPLSITPYQA